MSIDYISVQLCVYGHLMSTYSSIMSTMSPVEITLSCCCTDLYRIDVPTLNAERDGGEGGGKEKDEISMKGEISGKNETYKE